MVDHGQGVPALCASHRLVVSFTKLIKGMSLQKRKLIAIQYIGLCPAIISSIDKTETGYALGQPSQREAIPSTERFLLPSACAIMRALMHCSLLWISCTKEV